MRVSCSINYHLSNHCIILPQNVKLNLVFEFCHFSEHFCAVISQSVSRGIHNLNVNINPDLFIGSSFNTFHRQHTWLSLFVLRQLTQRLVRPVCIYSWLLSSLSSILSFIRCCDGNFLLQGTDCCLLSSVVFKGLDVAELAIEFFLEFTKLLIWPLLKFLLSLWYLLRPHIDSSCQTSTTFQFQLLKSTLKSKL